MTRTNASRAARVCAPRSDGGGGGGGGDDDSGDRGSVTAEFAVVLPAALVVCPRGLFWPLVPRVETTPRRAAPGGRA